LSVGTITVIMLDLESERTLSPGLVPLNLPSHRLVLDMFLCLA